MYAATFAHATKLGRNVRHATGTCGTRMRSMRGGHGLEAGEEGGGQEVGWHSGQKRGVKGGSCLAASPMRGRLVKIAKLRVIRADAVIAPSAPEVLQGAYLGGGSGVVPPSNVCMAAVVRPACLKSTESAGPGRQSVIRADTVFARSAEAVCCGQFVGAGAADRAVSTTQPWDFTATCEWHVQAAQRRVFIGCGHPGHRCGLAIHQSHSKVSVGQRLGACRAHSSHCDTHFCHRHGHPDMLWQSYLTGTQCSTLQLARDVKQIPFEVVKPVP